ncbi:hypothetical protein [Nostoc commune]|uniref:hypothetical protein n=1 Tax=Nostoc commune TaxID=1178 RepID=UPI0018C74A64|nr:hypothetical protein [Nostoc commune]MBG1263087.1 hypothetical protein [Nostoc commune BAE]
MTKYKISSKILRAKSLVIYELDQFIEYIRTIDPELEPDQAIVLTAFILDGLPELFEKNPTVMNQVKDIATKMKLKRRQPLN